MATADLLLQTLRPNAALDAEDLRDRWRRASTRRLRTLIEYEACTLWLVRRMHDLNAFDALSAATRERLAGSARQIAANNLVVEAERDAVIRVLNELDVPHVLLKGAARAILAPRYPYADARVISDVDVLVPAARGKEVWDHLRGRDYQCAPNPARYDRHMHLAPLWTRRQIPVELHTTTSLRVTPAAAWDRQARCAVTVDSGGGRTRVPCATELLWHAVSHAPLESPDAFRLRFLQDAAVIWAASDEIDWHEVASRLRGAELEYPERAWTWLAAAACLAGVRDVPEPLGALPVIDLASLLRWRHAVVTNVGAHPAAGDPSQPAFTWRNRVSRLLIDEATQAMLGMPLGHPGLERTGLAWAAHLAAARAGRAAFAVWRLADRRNRR